MKMIIPPECAGQMQEVSYGWLDGYLYRRVYDRADRTSSWAIADEDASHRLLEEDESWEAINGEPDIAEEYWTSCAEPSEGEEA